jgi:hypothetical protein
MKLLPLSLILIISGSLYAQEITFTFNPPDMRYTEIQKTNKITKVNDKTEKEDLIELTTDIYLKKNNNGYTLRQIPIKLNYQRNGEVFQNPIFTFLTNISTTGIIDSMGYLIHVSGYENLIPRAKETLPENIVESLILIANEEAMINKKRAEWNARISEFSGQKVFIGDMFSGEGKFPLPNGEVLTFFSVIKIDDTLEYNNKKCVRIKFKNSSEPEDLASFMGYSLEETSQIFDFNKNDELTTEIKLSGDGERIIDPETMIIQYERTFRKVDMKSEIIGDQSKNTTSMETKEYIYEF